MTKLLFGLPERFWAKTRTEDHGYVTPCLTWTGSRTKAGYGNFKIGGITEYAHRLVFAARHGEIPAETNGDRAVLDHLCRNRACVNVTHLELVGNRDNILRGDTLMAAAAAQSHCAKGHEFTDENTIRRGKYGVRECRRCRNDRRRAANWR